MCFVIMPGMSVSLTVIPRDSQVAMTKVCCRSTDKLFKFSMFLSKDLAFVEKACPLETTLQRLINSTFHRVF